MTANPEKIQTSQPNELAISRTFKAPRQVVFQAWSSAEHMKRWFCPETYSVPAAEVDFRVGGIVAICMRSPDGQENWCRGPYLEISSPERLVFDMEVTFGDVRAFNTHTVVTFETVRDGTCMTVHQSYEMLDEKFRFAPEGAPDGWRTTLDKLEQEVARMEAAIPRSVVHAMFTLERTYDAPPDLVFRALSDPAAKAKWFGAGDAFTILERQMDVRPGGREVLKARWSTGTVSFFDAIYHDVIPNQRLVYAYEMSIDDRKISVSLATLELKPTDRGTRLIVTEQGAFLDGYDDAASREHGTAHLLDLLGASLKA